MSKIYVITAGMCDDYDVVAVFSDKDVADRFVELNGFCEVGEYELDKMETQVKKGLVPWEVVIWLSDGEVHNTGLVEFDLNDFRPDVVFHKDKGFTVEEESYLRVTCYAKNGEHAVKIAAEKRAEYITEKDLYVLR